MNFIESETGLLINLDDIRTCKPFGGGAWKVIWRDGAMEIFTRTDGDAIRAAIKKPKPGRPPKPKTT